MTARASERVFEPRPDLLPDPVRPLGTMVDRYFTAGRAPGGCQSGPMWNGDPSAHVVIELSGGLGDAVRDLAFAVGLARSGRAAAVSVWPVPGAPPELRALLRWAEVPTWDPEQEAGGAIFNLWRCATVYEGRGAPRPVTADHPALGLAARAYGVSLGDLAGPVLRVPGAVSTLALAEVGTDRTGPVIAVDVGGMPPALLRPHVAELAAELLAGRPPEPGDPDAGAACAHVARLAKYSRAIGAAVRPLLDAGARVVLVGGARRWGPHSCGYGSRPSIEPVPPELAGAVDFRGRSLPALAAVLSVVDAFVGPDSGPLHLAGILGVPSVGVFTLTDPRVHVVSARTVTLTGSAPCRPCAHRFTAGPLGGVLPCAGLGRTFAACAEVAPAEVARVALDVAAGRA